MYIYSSFVMHALSEFLSHAAYIYYIHLYGTDDVSICTASGAMMFCLTISVRCDVGMVDIFAVCVRLFDHLFHRYMVLMVLDSPFCACVRFTLLCMCELSLL